MYYIYILFSPVSDIYYIGYSDNFNRRLSEHNDPEDKNTFTNKHKPWVLKAAFECGADKSTAIQLERFLKKQKSRKLIERMISGEQ